MYNLNETTIKIVTIAINIIIILLELYVFKSIKRKKDIFKYYTFYQNLLLFLASIIYLVFMNINLDIARGVRYIATTGALTAAIIYFTLLSNNKKNRIQKKDVNKKYNPNFINFLVHGLCPALALLNTCYFESKPYYNVNDIWTALASLPSIIYAIYIMYFTITKKWDEPYEFKSKNKFTSILSIVLIPIIFIFISYFVWQCM